MKTLMARIGALGPADYSHAHKSADMQERLDAIYDRDAVRTRLAAAGGHQNAARRLLDELDRIPCLLEKGGKQTRSDLVHQAVREVRILADRDPRRERVVWSITFKCLVRWPWEQVPGTEDLRDGTARDETVAVLERA